MKRFTYTVLFTLCLSALMSGWVTFVNLGYSSGFLFSWGEAFLNAWPVAFIGAYLLSGPVNNITEKLVGVEL